MARVERGAATITRVGPEPLAMRLAQLLLSGFARVFSVLLLLAAWEALARSGSFTPYQLPAFSTVVERIWEDAVSGDLWISTALTLYRALTAFAICAVLGVAIGVAMTRSIIANWFFDPIISVGFPMPKIAFLPVVILWLGVFDVSKITIVVRGRHFSRHRRHGHRHRRRRKGADLVRPQHGRQQPRAAHPDFAAGGVPADHDRTSGGAAARLIVAVVAEMLMGGYGLGAAMMTASRFANSPGVFAGIVEIAVVGYALVKAMGLIRRRLLIWHAEAHEPSTV